MAGPIKLPDVIPRDGAYGDIGAINRCQTTTASLRDESSLKQCFSREQLHELWKTISVLSETSYSK
jgi:hypothetical protein